MTKGRVYVTLDSEGKPKFISCYDNSNKRIKQIDLDRPHKGAKPEGEWIHRYPPAVECTGLLPF